MGGADEEDVVGLAVGGANLAVDGEHAELGRVPGNKNWKITFLTKLLKYPVSGLCQTIFCSIIKYPPLNLSVTGSSLFAVTQVLSSSHSSLIIGYDAKSGGQKYISTPWGK